MAHYESFSGRAAVPPAHTTGEPIRSSAAPDSYYGTPPNFGYGDESARRQIYGDSFEPAWHNAWAEPEQPGSGFIARHKGKLGLLLATSIAASGAGIVYSHDSDSDPAEKQASVEQLYASPTDATMQRVVDMYAVRNALDATGATISSKHGVRSTVDKVAAGNKGLSTLLNDAVDASIAEDILTMAHTDTVAFHTFDYGTTKSPKNRANLIASVYIHDAESAMTRINTSDYLPAQARADIQAHMPKGNEASRNHALDAIDVDVAKEAIGSIYNDASEAEARKALPTIVSPRVRKAAERSVDLQDAEDIINQLSFDGITVGEARKDARDIKDAYARKQVRAAMNLAHRADAFTVVRDIKYDVAEESRDQSDRLKAYQEPFEADKDAANEFYTSRDDATAVALYDADTALGKQIAASANMHLGIANEPPALANPKGTMDFTGVTGLQRIHNNYKRAGGSYTEDESKLGHDADVLEQFAEARVEDGKVVFDFQEGGGMTDELQAAIRDLHKYVAPYANAAFASGELTAIRFVKADTFRPAYAPNSREVLIFVGADAPITREEYVLAVRHEIGHALTRNEMRNDVAAQPEDTFVEACRDMREAVHEDLETHLQIDPTVVSGLQKVLKSKHKKIGTALEAAVGNGTLERLLALNPEYATLGDYMSSNDCENMDTAALVISRTAIKQNVVTSGDELSYLFESPEYGKLEDAWTISVEGGSPQKTVINEHNYVSSGKPDVNYGHSEENSSETFASTFNTALGWPKQLKANLASVPAAVRKSSLHMMDACMDIIDSAHPSLRRITAKVRGRYGLAA